jgi:anti-anti-sigma factor
MHDRLLQHQGALGRSDLAEHARAIGLDVDRFLVDLSQHSGAGRIAEDVDSADRSGVVGTPTFFVDGRRLRGHFDADALTAMIETARLRRMATTSAAPDPDLTGAVPCGHAGAPSGPALAAAVVDADVPAHTGVPPSVHVVGELDCSSAAVVREQLLSALARGTGPFVVDLAALTFVDSSGLRALEEAATAARQRGRSFSVVGAQPSARRLFALCGFPLHHHPEWSSPPHEAAADPDRAEEGA